MVLKVAPFVLSLLGAHAYKDSSYYMAGSGNPNVDKYPMYWMDSQNVLEDLDQFSGLYVVFEHCAWTMMQYQEDEESVDESDLWYQNKVPPMGANVAFSLYGQLKGENFKGCGKNTFIKSFYTTEGFQHFSNAMYYAGVNGFSYSNSDDDGSYSAGCNSGYGVGCTYSNGFTYLQYSDYECNPANATAVIDSMSDINSAMNDAQCIQIYDSSDYTGYVYGTPLELLSYSRSCMYQNFFSPEGECPDPYGRLQDYQDTFNKGIKIETDADPYLHYQRLVKGKILSAIGAMLVLAAGAILMWDKKRDTKSIRSNKKKTPKNENEEEEDYFTTPKITVTRSPTAPASMWFPTSIMSMLSMGDVEPTRSRSEPPPQDDASDSDSQPDGLMKDDGDDSDGAVTAKKKRGVMGKIRGVLRK